MPSPLKLISIFVCILLVIGYINRRRARIHVPLMLLAILIDVGIVVYIEVMRGAVASAKAKMGPLMIVHLALSCSVLIMYGVQIVTGIGNVRGHKRRLHTKTAPWLLAARFGNLVTSFLVS